MDSTLLTPMLSGVAGALLGAAATIVGVHVQNRAHLERARLELASQEKRHERDLHSRFLDHLVKPRIEGHIEILTALWVLRSAAAKYITTQSSPDLQSYEQAKNNFDQVLVLNLPWLRTPAAEEVSNLSRDLDTLLQSRRTVEEVLGQFKSAYLRLEWSLGIEDLEDYMQLLSTAALEARLADATKKAKELADSRSRVTPTGT